MSRRGYYILGALLLVAFAGFSLASFRSTLTPYVSYPEARSLGRTVQVAGGLDKGSSRYDEAEAALVFNLVDPASQEKMTVRYHGVKPANFEDAISIVAIGNFDATRNEFAAGKLLVKCPSKYQGAEVKTYS
ncbi:MAG: cytochrome c maturation protein CcmE [Holophagales bacterium]|jgi:cytochrome c-type biogenesis protein CcmE|nr:MAG: cytochrome c maturation protein CcmE [Holophagales bacterium]